MSAKKQPKPPVVLFRATFSWTMGHAEIYEAISESMNIAEPGLVKGGAYREGAHLDPKVQKSNPLGVLHYYPVKDSVLMEFVKSIPLETLQWKCQALFNVGAESFGKDERIELTFFMSDLLQSGDRRIEKAVADFRKWLEDEARSFIANGGLSKHSESQKQLQEKQLAKDVKAAAALLKQRGYVVQAPKTLKPLKTVHV